MDNTYPYNRIVQWLAGPVSAGVGLLVAWLATKIGLVHTHQAAVTGNLTALGMVAVGAGVTYMAHHKWLTNLGHVIQSGGGTTVVNNAVAPVDDEPADVAGLSDPEPAGPPPIAGDFTLTAADTPPPTTPSS